MVGTGHLRLEDFERFIDHNPQLQLIELSNYGEIFLNPELVAIFAYAQEKGVSCSAINGVNFNTVKDEVIEALVVHEMREISFSIDGASQETYGKYRVRGDFEVVLRNIRKLVEYKRKHRSDLPRMRWQYILFGHNQHEVGEARALAAELGMDFVIKLSWDEDFSPIQDAESARQQLGIDHIRRSEQLADTGQDYMQDTCLQLWNFPQINWDGKILGCCRNYWGDFGGGRSTRGSGQRCGMRRWNMRAECSQATRRNAPTSPALRATSTSAE